MQQIKQGMINRDHLGFFAPPNPYEADRAVDEGRKEEEEETKSRDDCSLSLSLSLDPIPNRRRSYGILSSCDSSITTEMFSSNSRIYCSDNHNCTDGQNCTTTTNLDLSMSICGS